MANIYLHYVLDNWFDVMVTRKYKGETHLVRFADDFICCFQYKNEAERFLLELKQRFCKYGLQLADEKTKIIQFGRFAMQDRKDKGLGKPETFDFLGFTFYCSTDSRKRFFRCKVKTCRKKYIAKVKAMNEWVKTNRNLKLDVLFCLVNLKLQGHYNYYGVTDNSYAIRNFYYATLNILFKWLNRRSDKRSYDWNSFAKGLLRTFPLKQPRICYSLLSS